jgi:hypothetical protein
VTTTSHCWVWLCVLKMLLGKYVDPLQGGAECEFYVKGKTVKKNFMVV